MPERSGQSEIVMVDPNAKLLKWRLWLALALTGFSALAYFGGFGGISGAGLVGSIGLMYTTLAASWAGSMARFPDRPLLAAQLVCDTIALALVVHFTGGPYSAFPLLFCVPIMLGATFLGSRWAVILAGAAAITTGGGHFGLAVGWLLTGQSGQLHYMEGWPVVVTSLHVGLFLVVGMISGDLAARLMNRNLHMARTDLQFRKARCEVRNILDNIRSGLITVDRDGLITRVNPSCCTILKAAEADLLGRNISEAMLGGMENLSEIIRPVARGGEPVDRGEIVVHRFGRDLPLGLNVNPVTSPRGRVIGAIAIFADLTREKEMTERIREADRLAAIGELAASIAHEIRNPLSSIRGSVELLASDLELEGYQSQLFELVLKESGRVNTIINDFLAYSRMRPVSLRRFGAAEFRDEITLQVRQHISAKGGRVTVSCVVEPETLQLVADPGQLTQMTLNLSLNACEAMAYQGELRIMIRQLDAGKACELVVTDTGPGIDPDIRKQLFSPFKTTKEHGTGLGLSVVARIVSAHGGRVLAEDAPGGGACFRIQWPQFDKQYPQSTLRRIPGDESIEPVETQLEPVS
ncbi:MAG: PAS domain-containing protein [Gemmatimonadales bacterium]|nr:PAS domain-containing protein [Gemmatimonadales bacterium]